MTGRRTGEAVPAPKPESVANAAGGGQAHGALLAALERTIRETLDPRLPDGCRVALVDFPHVPNVGDSAIWLGTLAYLARRGIRPRFTCSNRSYSRSALARRIGNGVILLSGGGNFGDLYPPHQDLREAVIRHFPRNTIVQLPQTIHFESLEKLARARQILDAHPDFTLLVRDASSLALAREQFRAPSLLCPDMAFALGAQSRPAPPTHPVVWLARNDKESPTVAAARPPAGVFKTDWLLDEVTPTVKLNRRLGRLARELPTLRRLLQGTLSLTYEPVARERVQRGMRALGAGRVVVTNRLHGHVLCLMMGIPHVVMDNSYGKVRGFYEAWTRSSPLALWGDSEAAALERALEMADARPPTA
jgi:exopolysaccharide biosynthesis predicted pyruvyltransferase EpsI